MKFSKFKKTETRSIPKFGDWRTPSSACIFAPKREFMENFEFKFGFEILSRNRVGTILESKKEHLAP